MNTLSGIVTDISAATNLTISDYKLNAVGGGCINEAYHLTSTHASFFIKLNKPHLVAMFEAEAAGLAEMSQFNAVRVPNVICFGQADGYSYIVLEYIKLGSLRGQSTALLGQQLAELHRHEHAYYGWHCDNTIGSTEQINTREHDWTRFWQQHRLGQQLKFAESNGYTGKLLDRGYQLIDKLEHFFVGYCPHPSLVHGDLWGGNAASDDNGNPVIFDPASYYGDRETDLAMTELFGGFGADFFSEYDQTYPLDPGYQTRKTLYNLYHIINHVNLFGGGYLSQAESMIEQLLAEL
jgi:protein-ribulosamine 3-kinase